MTPIVAACVASLTTMAAMAERDRLRPPSDVMDAVGPTCAMAIVLVAADDSAIARAIDATTGRLGWSHVYFDPCVTDGDGRRRVIAYTVRDGVHWTDPNVYKSNRTHARIDLDPRTGGEILGCIRMRLGRPFRVSHLLRGIDSAATCVGLLVSCMPWKMQQELRAVQVGPCISPNTIAAYFGVPSP